MRATGKMINSTDMAFKLGQMAANIKAITMVVRSAAKVSIPGRMGALTRETGKTTESRVKASIYGQMVASMKETGY